MKNLVQTKDAPQAIGPYSQAVVSNGFVFVSGQIPINPASGMLLTGTIQEQTQQVLENLSAILLAAGSSLDAVVKTTVYLKDMTDFPSMNEVYATFFGEGMPARATVEVARLPRDVAVEIDAIAALESK